jgi:hypothetical protein
MKLAIRIAVAFAALALAAPVLACEGHQEMKTTEKQEAKQAVATAAEKAPPATKAPAAQAQKPAAKPAPATPN